MLPDLEQVRRIVIDVANSLLPQRFAVAQKNIKPDGSIVTDADFMMQRHITLALEKKWPTIPLVGEETAEVERDAKLSEHNDGLWCLDPVDGTSNFSAGIPFFAVSLALLIHRKPVLGVVYDPMRDEFFAAIKDQGAWLNGVRLSSQPLDLPLNKGIGNIDFKRLSPSLAAKLAQQPPYSSQRSFGSVALDWCWLAANRYHVYLHGKQKVWDYAAGCLILSEAGGRSSTLEGEPVFTPEMQPRSAVAALDPTLYDEWMRWLNIAIKENTCFRL